MTLICEKNYIHNYEHIQNLCLKAIFGIWKLWKVAHQVEIDNNQKCITVIGGGARLLIL